MAAWAPAPSPGTGPVSVLMLPTVIVLAVMPGAFEGAAHGRLDGAAPPPPLPPRADAPDADPPDFEPDVEPWATPDDPAAGPDAVSPAAPPCGPWSAAPVAVPPAR